MRVEDTGTRSRRSARACLGVAGAAILLALAACGSSALSASLRSTPAAAGIQSSSGTTAQSQSLRTTVSHAPGAPVIDVTVTVAGPAELQGGCQPTLEVVLLDSTGAAVPMPARPGEQCLAITVISIPPGTTRDFTAEVPVPPDAGTYVVSGSLRGGPAIPRATVTI